MTGIAGIDYLLTETLIKKAQPKDKPYKLADGRSLYLAVETNGQKYWRFRYRFGGKEKMISMGTWPETSAEEARDRTGKARALLRNGVDPSEERRETKSNHLATYKNSFETIAREWYEKRKAMLKPNHALLVLRRLEGDLFPALGHRPIVKITAQELLAALQKVEARGAIEVAHRLLQHSGQVFRYAVASGRAERNISVDLRGALKTVPVKHHNHLKEADLPEFLEKLMAYNDNGGELQTQLAIQLLVLTFVRTSELREATWDEINFEEAEWRIPAVRMKMNRPHIVPLSRQALEVLRVLRASYEARESCDSLLFPGEKSGQHMSNNTMLFALYRMGYHGRATGHGFRTTASTTLNELGFRSDLIELQLAHIEGNSVRAAYNNAQYLRERRRMMQWWADYLDAAKQGVSVADFRKKIFPDIDVKNEQLFCRHG